MADEKKKRTWMIAGVLVILVAVLWYLLKHRGAAGGGVQVPIPNQPAAPGAAPLSIGGSSYVYNTPALQVPSCTKVCDECEENQYGPLDIGYGGVPEPTVGVVSSGGGGTWAKSVTELATVGQNTLYGSAGWTQTGVNNFYAEMGIANPTFGF